MVYTLGEGLWGVAGRGGVHIRGGALGRGREVVYTLGEGLWGVAGRGGVHIRGGPLGRGRERWCTH